VAPLPGEHTEQILKELNYRADEIERLRERGALG
jgi:crotonobetainyl-CoA:carnitine CoA-transferase CaiB-like acyl-CoA transferase